jgi:hypothetical protein
MDKCPNCGGVVNCLCPEDEHYHCDCDNVKGFGEPGSKEDFERKQFLKQMGFWSDFDHEY